MVAQGTTGNAAKDLNWTAKRSQNASESSTLSVPARAVSLAFRWCRCAQPPATILNPFGMKIAQAQIAASPKI